VVSMEVNLTTKHSGTPYTGYLKYFRDGIQVGPIFNGIYNPNTPIPYDIYPVININENWSVKVKSYYKKIAQCKS
jgi:hypothetical protein